MRREPYESMQNVAETETLPQAIIDRWNVIIFKAMYRQ
jgi:hypothetical protein